MLISKIIAKDYTFISQLLGLFVGFLKGVARRERLTKSFL
jgi:uncharacterized membrane protein required for colicin V production